MKSSEACATVSRTRGGSPLPRMRTEGFLDMKIVQSDKTDAKARRGCGSNRWSHHQNVVMETTEGESSSGQAA